MFAIDMMLRAVEWGVEPADETKGGTQDDEAVAFVESLLEDMSHTWPDFISEALSMLVFGFSYFEIVYKRRGGPDDNDPTNNSKHNDGLIGVRKLAIRSQESLQRWQFDENGGLQAFVQMPPEGGGVFVIPIDKSLLFRTRTDKGNPEGRSVMRNAVRPWFFKKRLEEAEVIGHWRDLAGVPVAKIPAKCLIPTASASDKAVAEMFKKIVRDSTVDEQAGFVIPSDRDEKGNPLYELALLSTGGRRAVDTRGVIVDKSREIAMSVLADFIMLGQTDTGSYALSTDKTNLFTQALQTFIEAIAAPLNRFLLPRIWRLNNFPPETMPRLVPAKVAKVDLAALGAFLQTLAGVGMPLFPDDGLDSYVRRVGDLPPAPEGGVPLPPAPTLPPVLKPGAA
jgi:hypothetical protein